MAQAKVNAIYYEKFGMSLNILYFPKGEMQRDEPRCIDLYYIGNDRIARKLAFLGANVGIIGNFGSSSLHDSNSNKPTFEELANMKELPIIKEVSKLYNEKLISRSERRKLNHKGGKNKAFKV